MICPCCQQPFPDTTDAEIAAEVERLAKYRQGSPKHAAQMARVKALQAAKKRASAPPAQPRAYHGGAVTDMIDPADVELVALVCTLGNCSEKEALAAIAKARVGFSGTLQDDALKACALVEA